MPSCCLQMDDEPFNPDYVEVDRVLDMSESRDENGEVLCSSSNFLPGTTCRRANRPALLFCVQMVTLHLVKWCSLPYEDSTWELKADIDQSKIEEYQHIVAHSPSSKRVVNVHASPPPSRRVLLCWPSAFSFLQIYSSLNCLPQGHVLVVSHTHTHTSSRSAHVDEPNH